MKAKVSLSRFGEKLGTHTGILELMHDLGVAMSGAESLHMLGGGNPAAIPEVQRRWHQGMTELLKDADSFGRVLVNYDTPRGRPRFMKALADYLNREYDWGITEKNIAVTNGSQSAFFALFNMLAGEFADGSHRRILLPLMPEYIGYADQAIDPGLFVTGRPRLDLIGDHQFKYRVDFDQLPLDDSVAAICVSRPTNPTGNVLTDAEIARLSDLARERGIPLMIDNAYGAPFPGILFVEAKPIWAPHIILSLSLSKLGLPGTRTGIVIADEPIVKTLSAINAVLSLANGNLGQELVAPMLETSEIDALCDGVIRPFYREKAEKAQAWLREFMPTDRPWRTHVCEGAMFLWLWCEGLPIPSRELYQRLRQRGVLVVSGHYFFFGDPEGAPPWPHRDECLRINYSQPEETVREGLRIIAEEVSAAYREAV